MRIVSLLPSATELIAVVLKEAEPNAAVLVGRSHECDWPEDLVNGLPMLTSSKIRWTSSADVDRQVREQLSTSNGLYSVDEELLQSLKPDVIVTQSLCKVCSVDYCLVEAISTRLDPSPKVVDTNPTNLEDVLQDLRRIGYAIGLSSAGEKAAQKLENRINAVAKIPWNVSLREKNTTNGGVDRPASKVVGFMEWTEPIFVGGHWTPQIIELAGGLHPLNPCLSPGKGAGKSITVTTQDFKAIDPDVIVIAPCGLDLTKTKEEVDPLTKEDWWKSMRAVQNKDVWIVDGNQMFNRPGPRLIEALEWLVPLLEGRLDDLPKDFPAERL